MNLRGRRWVFPALLLILVGLTAYVLSFSAADWVVTLVVVGLALANTPWFQKFWKPLPLPWKVSLVSLSSVLFLSIAFLVNLHKQNATFDNLACAGFLLSLLFLWALYSLMSRGLDALWVFIKEHK